MERGRNVVFFDIYIYTETKPQNPQSIKKVATEESQTETVRKHPVFEKVGILEIGLVFCVCFPWCSMVFHEFYRTFFAETVRKADQFW